MQRYLHSEIPKCVESVEELPIKTPVSIPTLRLIEAGALVAIVRDLFHEKAHRTPFEFHGCRIDRSASQLGGIRLQDIPVAVRADSPALAVHLEKVAVN